MAVSSRRRLRAGAWTGLSLAGSSCLFCNLQAAPSQDGGWRGPEGWQSLGDARLLWLQSLCRPGQTCLRTTLWPARLPQGLHPCPPPSLPFSGLDLPWAPVALPASPPSLPPARVALTDDLRVYSLRVYDCPVSGPAPAILSLTPVFRDLGATESRG